MANRITLQGKLLEVAKVRTFEVRSETFEVVQLWIEVTDGQRRDRRQDALGRTPLSRSPASCATIAGRTRPPKPGAGKIYIAVEPGEGTVRSKGLATAEAAWRLEGRRRLNGMSAAPIAVPAAPP
jgi:hypothetical protein